MLHMMGAIPPVLFHSKLVRRSGVSVRCYCIFNAFLTLAIPSPTSSLKKGKPSGALEMFLHLDCDCGYKGSEHLAKLIKLYTENLYI